MGRNPDHRVILASYGATLARKNSRYARNILRMSRYYSVFPQVILDARSGAADAWDLVSGGTDYVSWQWTDDERLEFYRDSVEGGSDAMGVGGGVTGKGGHIIIVDDPVKSRKEAESETYRNSVWDWFTNDLYTRREPGAAVIVVMTRWHQDDLVGRLMLEQPDRWERLHMPALAVERDRLGRLPGAALWSARYNEQSLAEIEAMLGPYSWSSLYQQRPTPAEGGIFKRTWFEPAISQTPDIQYAARYWDLAMSEKTSADYTVGIKLGFAADGHYYVLDVVRRQLDWGDVTPFMASVILADGPQVAQGVEEKGYMSRAIQDLNADHRLHGYAVRGYSVDTDKLTRALPVAARCAAGQVHLVLAHWNTTFIDEVCSFPNAAHDDQVDALSGAWAMMGMQHETGAVYFAADNSFGIGTY
jgi:predicted phage terminase large subunit-like protein